MPKLTDRMHNRIDEHNIRQTVFVLNMHRHSINTKAAPIKTKQKDILIDNRHIIDINRSQNIDIYSNQNIDIYRRVQTYIDRQTYIEARI